MLQTTIRKALTELKSEDIPHHRLYVIRDGDLVLYIGRSISPLSRLREHLGMTGRGGQSDIGACILHDPSKSQSWIYEVLTVSDCRDLIERYDTMDAKFCKDTDPASIEAAEEALIIHYRPCLNGSGNPNPTPLPSEYEWRSEANPLEDVIGGMLGLKKQLF